MVRGWSLRRRVGDREARWLSGPRVRWGPLCGWRFGVRGIL